MSVSWLVPKYGKGERSKISYWQGKRTTLVSEIVAGLPTPAGTRSAGLCRGSFHISFLLDSSGGAETLQTSNFAPKNNYIILELEETG